MAMIMPSANEVSPVLEELNHDGPTLAIGSEAILSRDDRERATESAFHSLSMTAIARLFGFFTAAVASAPNPISISPSPVTTKTRRFGCARASPNPTVTALPIAPQR